ncbi:MAG: LysM peptidoglycan-binding domain-containing protein [Sphaerochaetaceae bacterium]
MKNNIFIFLLLLVLPLALYSNDIFTIAESGTVEEMQKAIKSGADVNARNEDGISPSILALKNSDNPQVLSALLNAGANLDVNFILEEKETLLMSAIKSSSYSKFISLLIGAEEDVNAKVEKEQILAVPDKTPYQIQFEQAETAYLVVDSTYKRIKLLFEVKASTQKILEEIKGLRDVYETQMDLAKIQMDYAKENSNEKLSTLVDTGVINFDTGTSVYPDSNPDFSGQTATDLEQSLGKKYQKQVVWTNYTCKDSDILEKIALNNGISLSTLLSVNKIKNLDAISVGTVLRVPDRDGSIYVVKKDNRLGTIVQKLDLSITWLDLQEINGLDDDKIKEGQELFIPDESSSANISTASRGLEFSSPLENGVEKIIFNTRFTDPITKEIAPLEGICLQAPYGSNVYASCAGEVLDIELNTGSRPNTVKVRHDGGYVTTYGYLATVEVGIGDSVTNQSVLGTISKENPFFDNAMLFFQIEQNGVCLDPSAFF